MHTCTLDALDAANGGSFDSVADGMLGGNVVPLAEVAKAMGVGERRVQQLADRALNKAHLVDRLTEAIEDWAERDVYPHGAMVDALWGVIADDEGQLYRRGNDADFVYVTVAIGVRGYSRPTDKVKR